MGNSPSRNNTSNPQSPSAQGNASYPKQPRRRESIQALSLTKPTAAPPSASLTTAHSTAPIRTHSRNRSQTIATAQLKGQDSTAVEKMGNINSINKTRSRDSSPTRTVDTSLPPRSNVTVPVPVPEAPFARAPHSPIPEVETESARDSYSAAPASFTRPPRLPLPIEEVPQAPGSPILGPSVMSSDATSPIEVIDNEEVLPRRSSMLSSTTMDEDEDDGLGNLHAQEGVAVPTVPTIIEWRGPGEKIYVTGTFANWDKKYKLYRDGPSRHPGALSALINLMPGTHHIKFIVDGDMRLSDQLPTAVDFTNILVNYIEVAPEDISAASSDTTTKPETKQSDIPAVQDTTVPQPILEARPATAATTPKPAPTLQPPRPTMADPTPIQRGPPKQYHNVIPRFLKDLEGPEDNPRTARATAAANSMPTPPSLPMFLGKSILNTATPTKDDSSVLVIPNHTVLNHLATSSIKNNILATSATTRYKRKFLTTILYKPKSLKKEEEEAAAAAERVRAG
ncbi:carbohydrate-binding module family 48 protein [Patellaria atrata CBS 101060]|uniref:Carbohydrate-binding module family 48 protein n=1 Tax=Patellaria atrata CBS 101060 TaxID=1346257 RepID=A0A9P4SGZ2_9PEZI|nr:carbohydrate-binding module family 48 protein [Patellaria atrata CBS 101060]